MNDEPRVPRTPLRIKTPCSKTWDELVGGKAKRFCSECSLHVHDAAQLTRREAIELASNAKDRVCMRIVMDTNGSPVHREERPAFARRFTGWMFTAAAGLLAACHRSASIPPARNPSPTPAPHETTKMGLVAPVEKLGDVALPRADPRELIGEVWPDPGPPSSTPTSGNKQDD